MGTLDEPIASAGLHEPLVHKNRLYFGSENQQVGGSRYSFDSEPVGWSVDMSSQTNRSPGKAEDGGVVAFAKLT